MYKQYQIKFTVTYAAGCVATNVYQTIADSELNACAKIGQIYNDMEDYKKIDILEIKRIG